MRRSVLIVMIDVMVLSALSLLQSGQGGRQVVPVHRWSSVVEAGLQKEAEYQEQIEALKQAAEEARLAQDQALREQQEAARLAAEARQREQAAREAAAVAAARKQEAEQRAASSETEAKSALEERQEAAVAASLAEERRKQAELKAQEAEQAAKAAAASLAALKAESEKVRTELEGSSQQLAAMQTRLKELQAREQAAREKAEQALVSEAQSRAKAEAAEQARGEALSRVQQLEAQLAEVREASQEKELKLQEISRQAEVAQEKLEKIEAEKRQSVWVVRDKAIRRFQMYMKEEVPAGADRKKRLTLYLPLVAVGERTFAVTDMESLEFDWRAIQPNGRISAFSLMMDDVVAGSFPHELKQSILVSKLEPRAFYIPVDKKMNGTPLKPIGMTRLKEQRIQKAILFNRETPDLSAKVEITPTLDNRDYVMVKPAEGARFKIKPGDYLLTENGFYIGSMLTDEKCYVLPEAMPPAEATVQITVTKPGEEQYFSAFCRDVNAVLELIGQLKD